MSQAPIDALAPKKVGIIIGSTRPNRIGDQVASLNLPLFNETILPAMVPAQGEFAHSHSKAWNAEIASYDAYVFVTAEWNFGLPGGTKNAIDYLYHAWIGK